MEKDQGEQTPMPLCLTSKGEKTFVGFEEVYVEVKKVLCGGEEFE